MPKKSIPVMDEQEIIEVDQTEVKKALKALMARENDIVSTLYAKHQDYNEEYFHGQLSYPLITIDKMSNRTLGNYTFQGDEMGITNHIRMNRNFIALNTEDRILQTLRHEMIHQWQDEVLYFRHGKPKTIKFPETEKLSKDDYKFTGNWIETEQKKFPKNTHNQDFKEMASVVGIPARGDKCHGNPAIMPEPKSYNRKFACGCVASNGHRMTIWSTREVSARCKVCGQDYVEIEKNGKVIEVTQSHIEKPGEDAVMAEMLRRYKSFGSYKTRAERDEILAELVDTGDKHEHGIYQKFHNMYKNDYRYWVAYDLIEEEPKKKATTKASKKPVEPPKPVEVPKEPQKPKKAPAKKLEPVTPVKKETPKKTRKIIKLPVKKKELERHKVPERMIQLYHEHGTIKGVAKALGGDVSDINRFKKQYNIDFGKGTYEYNGDTIIAQIQKD